MESTKLEDSAAFRMGFEKGKILGDQEAEDFIVSATKQLETLAENNIVLNKNNDKNDLLIQMYEERNACIKEQYKSILEQMVELTTLNGELKAQIAILKGKAPAELPTAVELAIASVDNLEKVTDDL
jgi:hypothetical protein